MATFTTEVRTICEQFAELGCHVDYNNIEQAIADSWEKIFGANWNTFDPEYKSVLCAKILRHYWMREIGCETVGLWLHYLNTRLGEIMPYYNKLYESAAMEFNPLHDYDLTHTSTRTEDGNTDSTSTITDTGTANTTSESESSSESSDNTQSTNESTGQNINKFSDTPQGALTGVLNGTYLTSATVDDSTGNQNSTRVGNSEESSTRKTTATESRTNENRNIGNVKATTTEDYVLKITGKTGGRSYAKLLMEYRQSLINIDSEIIDKLSDLFMGLWV